MSYRQKDEAIVALQQLAAAARQAPSADVLQQASQTNHFTLAEIWKDQTALEAHEIAAIRSGFMSAASDERRCSTSGCIKRRLAHDSIVNPAAKPGGAGAQSWLCARLSARHVQQRLSVLAQEVFG
jgi:hypothetical protein